MKKKLARSTYEFFNRNIIITTIVGSFPALWFTFVKIFDANLYLKDSTGNYVQWITVLNYVFIITTIVFILLKSVGDKYNLTVSRNGIKMIYDLITSINSYKSFKSYKFIKDANNLSPEYNKYCLTFKPDENISELLSIMNKYLCTIFGLKNYQIGLSVLYNYKDVGNDKDWKFIATESVKNDLSKEELINNPNSTVYKIIKGQAEYIFFADKNDAYKNDEYVLSKKDTQRINGSILCYNFGVNGIIAALSLTTYDRQICEVGDIESETKLRELAIETLSNRLLTEILIEAMNSKKSCHSLKVRKVT